MNNLLRLFKRYRHVLFFLVLEFTAVSLHFNFSYQQKAQAGLLLKQVKAFFDSGKQHIQDYFALNKTNQLLVQENIELRNQLEKNRITLLTNTSASLDSTLTCRYEYQNAQVVNNTVTRQHNFFTIDRGANDGVTQQMPIISQGHVAGIIVATSPRYAIAISLLNTDLKISAKLTRTQYYGSLSWDGKSYRYALLSEIPHHVVVNSGDTVVTSGFSNIFPADVLIGFVDGIESQRGDFTTLRIRLATDFKQLRTITLLRDNHRVELDSLQQAY